MKTIYKNRKIKMLFYGVTLFSLFVLVNLMSCSNDESCGYNEPCTFNQTNTELSGWTVATCHGVGTNPIGVIYDTSQNSTAPLGDDWGAILDPTPPNSPKAIHPVSWNSNNLGQVFGIAIDDSENVFLATSGIYNQRKYNYDNGSKSATIYKSSSPTWNATRFVNLPTSTGNLNDIGNIAFDKKNNQLFATNLEDGKIYRINGLNNTTGIIKEAYDPWMQDGLTSPSGIVSQDEQVWGVGVNYENGDVKIYFPRITSLGSREIYSITLNSDGSFPKVSSEIVEISSVPGNQLVISDIAFSSNTGEMLLAERGDPHDAEVISYSKTISTWNFNKKYFVGKGINGENSAGGVDFAYKEQNNNIDAICDDFFWASGHLMLARNSTLVASPANSSGESYVYGIQGISYLGNNPTINALDPFNSSVPANQDTDLFIDYDGNGSWNVKNGIGDVEVFDANECFNLCK